MNVVGERHLAQNRTRPCGFPYEPTTVRLAARPRRRLPPIPPIPVASAVKCLHNPMRKLDRIVDDQLSVPRGDRPEPIGGPGHGIEGAKNGHAGRLASGRRTVVAGIHRIPNLSECIWCGPPRNKRVMHARFLSPGEGEQQSSGVLAGRKEVKGARRNEPHLRVRQLQ